MIYHTINITEKYVKDFYVFSIEKIVNSFLIYENNNKGSSGRITCMISNLGNCDIFSLKHFFKCL